MDFYKRVRFLNSRIYLELTSKHAKGNINLHLHSNKVHENMLYVNYTRQLRKAERFLLYVHLVKGSTLAVTLTTKEFIKQSDLDKKFGKLVEALRRVDSSTAYIRSIDVAKKDNKFHLHVLFQFPNGIPKYKGRLLGKW